MGLDRPGITPAPKRKVRRKTPPPRKPVVIPDRVIDARPPPRKRPIKVDTGDILAGAADVAPAERRRAAAARARGPLVRVSGKPNPKVKITRQSDAPLPGELAGIARVLGHTTKAIGKTVYDDPLESTKKAAGQAGEIAKGVASTAIALPVYAAQRTIDDAIGREHTSDSPQKIVKRLVKGEAKRISDTYGPSFRGEKGASRDLQRKVKREGVLVPAMDVATVVAPTSLAAGAGVRKVAAHRAATGSKPGAIGKLVDRPAVRVTPLGAPTSRAPRKGAVGMAASTSHDAVRRGAQRVAVKRAAKAGKPLPARRALLRPGEVTPVLAPGRKLRQSTSTIVGHGERAAQARTARYVTDTSKRARSLRSSFKGLPADLEHAAITAADLGIVDAKGARAILTRRIKEIEDTVAAARADKKHPDHAAASRDDAHLDELAKLRSYLADPKLLERADVQRAAEGVRASPIGAREGLGPDRAAIGRVKHVAGTLGVKTAKQQNEAARVVRRQAMTATKRDVVKARNVRVKAEADLRVAKARGNPAAVAAAQATFDAARAASKVARDARKAANTRPPKVVESGRELAARVEAEGAKLGLAPPAHVRSQFARDEGLLPTSRAGMGEPNPLAYESKGTLYRTGREEKTLANIEENRARTLRRGARLEARSNVLAAHAKTFPSNKAANEWAQRHNIDTGPDSDMVIAAVPGGMARKGLVTQRTTKAGRPDPKADAGDYVKTADVALMPKRVYQELLDLDEFARKPPSKIKRALAGSQAALLALNPAWFQFQRVNDVVASTLGGALPSQASLIKLQRELKRVDPDAAEVLAITAGGSMSREMLTPHSAQKMGRIRQIIDANPTYREAWKSDHPASVLLLGGRDVATGLLRADQAITGGFRERQLLHNLRQVARKMDPDVRAVNRAFDSIGLAFKNGDVQEIGRLLKDPAYQAQLAEAAKRLDKIHGDWHNYTARELKFKQYAAFYGFLRYSTRLALFTLPLDHPMVGLLVARLGQMGAQDAKAIIGPDMPWGLGTLYNTDGTIAADFARANPLTGPLLSITKPEQLIGLSTPIASLALSVALNQPIGLSDSAQGYTRFFNYRGDPKDTKADVLSGDRGRVALAQLIRMLGPGSEWSRWDERLQTSDSLPWDRRIQTEPGNAAAQARLDEKNANRVGGLEGLAHNVAPVAFPGSRVNRRLQGASTTAAIEAVAEREQGRKDRRRGVVRRRGGSSASQFGVAPSSTKAASQFGVAPSGAKADSQFGVGP